MKMESGTSKLNIHVVGPRPTLLAHTYIVGGITSGRHRTHLRGSIYCIIKRERIEQKKALWRGRGAGKAKSMSRELRSRGCEEQRDCLAKPEMQGAT